MSVTTPYKRFKQLNILDKTHPLEFAHRGDIVYGEYKETRHINGNTIIVLRDGHNEESWYKVDPDDYTMVHPIKNRSVHALPEQTHQP